MKTPILFFILIFLGLNLFAHGPYKIYVSIKIKSSTEINHLPKFVHTYSIDGNQIKAFFYNKYFHEFLNEKLNFKFIADPELSKKSLTMASSVSEMQNWDKYPTYETYVQLLENMANSYPNICKLHQIGTSNEGRKILALKISDNPTQEEDEPEMFYSGQIHGDEIVTYILFLRLADYILKNYESDNTIKALIDESEIWINPLSNPDGTYHGGNSTVSGAIRGNSIGVDMNRNYPDPRAGDHPDGNEWQTETVQMMEFVKQRNFILSANTHSGEEVINFPWDTWTRRHTDNQWFYDVSRRYTSHVYDNSTDYMTGFDNGVTNGSDWYIITGGRQDYMNYFQHCREITFELSSTKAINAEDLPNYWTYNRDALIGYMQETLFGIRGVITNTNGDPVYAKINLNNHDKDEDHSFIYSDKTKGDYHRMVEAGTYQMSISAYAHTTQTIDNITVTDFNSIRKDVVLQADADAFTLTGTITDKQSSEKINNAGITLKSTPYPTQYTNSEGQYSVSNIMEGTHTIEVFAADFWPQHIQTTIQKANPTLNFELDSIKNESFENGITDAWDNTSSSPWSTDAYQASIGSKSIKSGNISDGESSKIELKIGFSQTQNISFDVKTDTEEDYDFLYLYIDNKLIEKWSGQKNWTTFTTTLEAGMHTLSWQYNKDANTSSGEDAAWLDNFVFGSITEAYASFNTTQFSYNLAVSEQKNDTLIVTNTGGSTLTIDFEIENPSQNTWINLSESSASVQPTESKKIPFVIIAPPTGTYNTKILATDNTSTNHEFNVTINTSTSDINNQEINNQFEIYPNPFSQYFIIKNNQNSTILKMELFDVSGKKLATLNTTSTKPSYIWPTDFQNTKLIPNGLYFLKISNEKNSFNYKILKK